MSIRLASPLYIIREDCKRDLRSVLARLSFLGFDGVEFLGFFGLNAREVRDTLDALEMTAVGNHVPYRELLEQTDALLDFHREVGCAYITVSELPLENFAQVSKTLDGLADKARLHGIRLLVHNHDDELLTRIEGKEALAYILDNTKPSTLALEPDLGWMEIGGGDCAHYLTAYKDRCPVIHLKDYFSTDNSKLGRVRDFLPERGTAERGHFEFRPTGFGVLNLPRLMPLCLRCNPDWLVLDHDLAYERGSYVDLKMSLDYTRKLLEIQPPV